MSYRLRRPSRAFIPTAFGTVRLESRRMLDAASIAAQLAAIADTKAQYKADLAEWKTDKGLYNQDLISWKLDRNDMNVRIGQLNTDIDKFNDDYKPKSISFKQTVELDQVTGKLMPKISLEIDLGSLFNRTLHPNAESERTALINRGKAFDTEAKGLDTRLKALEVEAADLKARKDALDVRKMALDMAEVSVQMMEMDDNVAVTEFNDDDIANNE